MRLTPWRPFQDMDDFLGRYERLFNNSLPGERDDGKGGINAWTPSADISETKNAYLIKTVLPDVEKSDIHVSVKDGALTIEGERKHQDEEEGETFHRVESFYGKFTRTFSLPENVNESKIKADCKNGVLRVHLPKAGDSEPKSATEIKVS